MLGPTGMQRSLHSPSSRAFCRLRSLWDNKLGPAAGMAFAEALKGNTTLTYLRSAALPSNPLARASRALDMHPSFRALHPPPPLLARVSTPPRPRRERDQPFPACAPDQSCTRTAHTRPAHTRSTWPPPRQHPRRCHPRPHPAWTAATPSVAHGCVACARARTHLHLPVAAWGPTTSATTPSRPSKRPPAAASS